MEGCRRRCCCCRFRCSKLFISCLSLSRLSVVVVIIIIIASAGNHLQMTVSLPVSKSLRIETSGVGSSSYETRTKDRPGRYLSPHYQTVVSSLEAVGVLSDANESTTCFVLENLTKTWRPGIDGVSMVEVSLQVRQFEVPVGVRGRERGERRKKWSSDDNKAAIHETDNACLEWLIRTTTIITSTPTTTTTTTTTKAGVDDERRKGDLQEEDETSSASSGSGSGSAQSGRNKSTVAGEEPKAKEKPKQEEHTGLNKRQILVISTCSTVIGAFFVTAFILRIRNYMKRSKQEKDGTKRHNIRAASMPPHQRTHHGSLDHFANNENHRRWSHFNPFATDR